MSRLPALVFVVVLSGCGPTAGGSNLDAGPLASLDGGNPDAGLPRCTVTDSKVTCPPTITSLLGRDVYWQAPSSPAPAAGFPAVIVYQGSFFPPSATWGEVPTSTLFGVHTPLAAPPPRFLPAAEPRHTLPRLGGTIRPSDRNTGRHER